MENKKKVLQRPAVIIMILVIVALIIGIIIRWDYIYNEIANTISRMFFDAEGL